LRSITIEFHGHVATLNTRPLIASAIAGLLRPQLDNINMVNAVSVARDRGIEIIETKQEQPGDYEALIRLSVKTERRARNLAGTIFGGNRERIVEIKDIPIEAEWGAHMLYITNKDRPGVIGDLGKALGDGGVNIATFHLGRSAPGDDAIALLQVDQAISDGLLQTLEGLPNIVQVKALRF
jgi:D-3-phosphoglycerate dehydrogenase